MPDWRIMFYCSSSDGEVMESDGCLVDLLTKGTIWAGCICDGDSVPLHGGTKQRTLHSADTWETVVTEGVN